MNTIVRNYLIELARERVNQTVPYQKLSNDCNLGLDMNNKSHRDEIGHIIGNISRFEHSKKRPLISSLVVKEGGTIQGNGFFELAEELGFTAKEEFFGIEQINESIDFWRDNKNYITHKNI